MKCSLKWKESLLYCGVILFLILITDAGLSGLYFLLPLLLGFMVLARFPIMHLISIIKFSLILSLMIMAGYFYKVIQDGIWIQHPNIWVLSLLMIAGFGVFAYLAYFIWSWLNPDFADSIDAYSPRSFLIGLILCFWAWMLLGLVPELFEMITKT